ncbi:MAG: 3-dehydroquinate synthase [Leptospiraceae bacterium]|nr:3-dehydroquinate synthase [Leptospiraceae bacterium]
MQISSEKVEFGTTKYNVVLYENFEGLSMELQEIQNVSRLIIITEKKVSKLYLDSLLTELKQLSIPVGVIIIKGKEKNKHIDRLKKVYNQLIELNADRKSVILALGGGVVGDFSGFVAATFLRGIRFVQVPTTLLACVDSSVGGKVAVNADKGKNMIGAFHQPELVYAPLHTLKTLEEKEWKCGLAEVLKHSLLTGGEFFEKIKSANFESIYDQNSIKVFISESVKFKTSIVAEDEKETGKRAILNLGHTLGHAIESLTNYKKYSHGESVAIGLVLALILSKEKAGFSDESFKEVLQIMKNLKLPLLDKKLSPEKLVEHMMHDKKTSDRKIKFILLNQVGNASFGNVIGEEEIVSAIKLQNSL